MIINFLFLFIFSGFLSNSKLARAGKNKLTVVALGPRHKTNPENGAPLIIALRGFPDSEFYD